MLLFSDKSHIFYYIKLGLLPRCLKHYGNPMQIKFDYFPVSILRNMQLFKILEDTNGIIKSRILKERQYNGQKRKKDKH